MKTAFCGFQRHLSQRLDCEGAGEMFRVSTLDMQNIPLTDKGEVDYDKDFFGKESFLTVFWSVKC